MQNLPVSPETVDYIDLDTVRRDPRLTCVRGGQPVPMPTIYRWIYSGLRGVKLRTFLAGGYRACTRQSLDQFLSDLDRGRSIDASPTPTQRDREVESAVGQLRRQVSRKRPRRGVRTTH
jgi:hypothetical protein